MLDPSPGPNLGPLDMGLYCTQTPPQRQDPKTLWPWPCTPLWTWDLIVQVPFGPAPWPWDFIVQGPLHPLVTSGGQHCRPSQTCSPEDSPIVYWHLMATEAPTKRPACILLGCFLVFEMFILNPKNHLIEVLQSWCTWFTISLICPFYDSFYVSNWIGSFHKLNKFFYEYYTFLCCQYNQIRISNSSRL